MGQQTIPVLKEKFADGKTPPGSDFADLIDSYLHKGTKINQAQVFGLNDSLNDKASKDDLKNATTNFKGYHTSLSELQTAYPQAQNRKDFFAWVGSPYPGTVYKVFADGGAWTDTGEVPTQQEIDLAEYIKKESLTTEITDETETIPSNYAVNTLKKQLYGGTGAAGVIEVIPYSVGTRQSSASQFYYENQTAIKGKKIKGLRVNFANAGTFTVLIGKNINTSSYTVTKQKFNVTAGENIISLDLTLGSDEYLGFSDTTDTAKFLFVEMANNANPVGGGFYSYTGSAWDALKIWDLSIGVLIEGQATELSEIIPYNKGKQSSVIGQFFYINQATIQNLEIVSLRANFVSTGKFTVVVATGVNTASYSIVLQQEYTIAQTGEQILTLSTPIVLTSAQMIGFSSATDTAFFNCVNFDNNDAANPVGGGFYGKNISGSGWQAPNTKDLCVGILARSVMKTGDIDVLKMKVSDLEAGVIMPDLDLLLKDKTFSVLGDSISTYQDYALAGTFYPKGDITNVSETWWGILIDKYKMKLVANPSVGGARISGTSGNGVLSNNIGSLGANPQIIFVFGGTNDYGGKITIGEYNFYNAQDRNIFKQALCYTFDSLRATYPNSRIVFMTSMQRNYSTQSNGKFPNKVTDSTPFQYEYNDAAKETCKIYGIEVVDMYNCGITFNTIDLYTSDRIHPNKAGMAVMADYLYKSLIK